MKPRALLDYLRRQHGELINGWGEAELVRHLDGRPALLGGSGSPVARQ